MDKFSIKCTGCNVEEAMAQIGELSGLDKKQQNCLCLLTEEMFSMMNTVLENKEAVFAIAKEDDVWTLTMKIYTHISPRAREEYLSMATDGMNLAYRGLKGLFTAFVDAMANADMASMTMNSGFDGLTMDCFPTWQMSQYLMTLSEEDKDKAWDGLEKSIIANFADDVLVGVTEEMVKVVVKYSGKK